ncbi:hypothetical protein AX769_19690 [Frondihabitans sp. PAMC 28766]|uniref:HD domain-containing protein n=1 Tax=Frondihabitans sp. PAMC 28766 TaxID=1795630 RepID=UPI00078D6977|nr:HD domain-containing protein [Frondihabitans sp. PAMC 28766]AMM21960.1 hypothetical protein AX769_19690 [Frondihabitans sp. PAMC 28766]
MTDVDTLLTPPTATAALALETSRATASPALANHCLRSWAFAAALGLERGLVVDAELLFVAAMFHDHGVVPEFDAVEAPFEDAGGAVGWVFAAGAGWPVERRERVREVIQRHAWASVDPASDVEGFLLEAATTLDVRGVGAEAWRADLVAAVVYRVPRLDFSATFDAAIAAQASRKPGSNAARFAPGIADGARYWA